MTRQQTGVIYMLHFDQPYKHAKHYVGWTADLSTGSTSTPKGTALAWSQSSGKPVSASP